MAQNDRTPSERVAAAYNLLTASAATLNSASDELGKSISVFDAALRKLNLGVATWVKISGGEDEHDNYWGRFIGYAKVGGKWGIALSTEEGNHTYGEFKTEEWLFNDAPRSLRVEGIEKIADLIEQLVTESNETAEKIRAKTADAQQLAAAIASKSPATQRKVGE